MKEKGIGRRVRDLRTAREMTTTELGRKVGVSQAQISRLEHGQQGWRSVTLQKTAEALGVTVGFLYSDSESVAEISSLLKQRPALRKILGSPVLSELALKIAQLKSKKPAAYRAVKTIIDQLAG
jgi:transcriptional regulator with XRE-family HTH domain